MQVTACLKNIWIRHSLGIKFYSFDFRKKFRKKFTCKQNFFLGLNFISVICKHTLTVRLHMKLHSGINLTLVYGDVAITIYMFCWDELIPVKKTGIKFNSGIKKGKKEMQTIHPGKKLYSEHIF